MKIYLYDTETDCIGTGSLSSASIRDQLQAAAGADVEVHISSVGGSAFDAIAIYDLLKKYPGRVTTYIDALAASAASIVAMAGKTIIMGKYALLMVHKPMVGSGGNADELLRDVHMLNVVQSRLAQIYVDRSGLDTATVNSLINAATWMTAGQALHLGFIDAVEDYAPALTNSALIKNYMDTAPPLYRQCINQLLNKTNHMDNSNTRLTDKTTAVLNRIINYFKTAVNKQTITDRGVLHHSGEIGEGAAVYHDQDMAGQAVTGLYTTAAGQQLNIIQGIVLSMGTAAPDDDDNDEGLALARLKQPVKPAAVQDQLLEVRARLHAQNNLLHEARAALAEATTQLSKTREEVTAGIKSSFTPNGSKRSSKAKTETQPFFAPQSALAQNAVKKAVSSR